MGEIGEMMLEGTMCEFCGEYLGGDAPGFPRYCSSGCAEMRRADSSQVVEPQPRVKTPAQVARKKRQKAARKARKAAALKAAAEAQGHG